MKLFLFVHRSSSNLLLELFDALLDFAHSSTPLPFTCLCVRQSCAATMAYEEVCNTALRNVVAAALKTRTQALEFKYISKTQNSQCGVRVDMTNSASC